MLEILLKINFTVNIEVLVIAYQNIESSIKLKVQPNVFVSLNLE